MQKVSCISDHMHDVSQELISVEEGVLLSTETWVRVDDGGIRENQDNRSGGQDEDTLQESRCVGVERRCPQKIKEEGDDVTTNPTSVTTNQDHQ